MLKNQEYSIKVEEKELCSKCNERLKRGYHAWCQECFNAWRDTRTIECRVLYYIKNVSNNKIVYTGKSDKPSRRYEMHFKTTTATAFARMIHSTGADIGNYRMYVLDLSEFNVSDKEHKALEHVNNFEHRETVVNTDITVSQSDMDRYQDLDERGIVDKIFYKDWIEYNDFIHKKNKLSEQTNTDNLLNNLL